MHLTCLALWPTQSALSALDPIYSTFTVLTHWGTWSRRRLWAPGRPRCRHWTAELRRRSAW